MDLGDRIRSVRIRRGLSQRELAAASGVSLSLIRKLEQGEIKRTRMEKLRMLATAMRVPTTVLATAGDPEPSAADTVTRWEPVRRALAGQTPPGDGEPTVAGVEAALAEAMPALRANRFSELAPVLPGLIRDAHLLNGDGRTVQARVLTMAGRVLIHTHQYDAAEMALERAMDAAEDRHDASTVVHNLTWLLIRQGRIAECAAMSARWADDLEPRLSRATAGEISAWGWMLLRISLAAVRDNRAGEARDAMRLAQSAAHLVGREHQAGPRLMRQFGPALVAAKAAELEMIEDRPDRVLAIAATVPGGAFYPGSDDGSRHLLDVANAHARLGHTSDALEVLARIRAHAPEWLTEQRYARDVLRSMIERRRTLTPEMREMADAVRLEY